jgi:hypothetical protein
MYQPVCFLLPAISDSHVLLRVRGLVRESAEPEIFAFERSYYEVRGMEFDINSLGSIKNAKYSKRVLLCIKNFPKIWNAVRRHKAFYVYTFDLFLLLSISKLFVFSKKRIVYEVADIHPLMEGRGGLALILRFLERIFCKLHRPLIVVTSAAYRDVYFKQIQQLANLDYLLIENKFTAGSQLCSVQNQTPREGPITIGYFGIIRGQDMWEKLVEAIDRSAGRLKLYIRGSIASISMEADFFEKHPDIEYGGTFQNPADLTEMYQGIDISWIVPDDNSWNLKWQRVNRFYEACRMGVPMISRKGTQDAMEVERLNAGIVVDCDTVESILSGLDNITAQDLVVWTNSVSDIPIEVYCFKHEFKELMNFYCL